MSERAPRPVVRSKLVVLVDCKYRAGCAGMGSWKPRPDRGVPVASPACRARSSSNFGLSGTCTLASRYDVRSVCAARLEEILHRQGPQAWGIAK